jgi:beta-galactosidase
LRRLLGLVVPELWPHDEGETRHVTFEGERYVCDLWSDWIELESAEAVWIFEDGWLSGRPAVTRNGSAWYVGTRLEAKAMDSLVGRLAEQTDLRPPLEAPPGVEVVRREKEGGSFLFLLNHTAGEVAVTVDGVARDAFTGDDRAGTVTLEPFGVAVLRVS